MKRLLIISLLLSLIVASHLGYSQTVQDSTKTYKIETNDGNEFVGKIILMNSDIVKLKTANLGEITINRKDIAKMSMISKDLIKEGVISYGDLHSSRYFTTSNGYPLGKGHGYYQNMWIFYNQFGYGFGNNFSISAGIVPLFLFAGASSPVWITPRITIPIKKDRINLGAGILAATVLGENTEPFGYAYGVSTFGSTNNNLSIGIGYGYFGSNWANRPTISVSGKVHVGKKGYLMTENYYISAGSDNILFSLVGGRSLIRKVALDYGLIIPFYSGMEKFFAIPWLGITIPFGAE